MRKLGVWRLSTGTVDPGVNLGRYFLRLWNRVGRAKMTGELLHRLGLVEWS